jgi:hypothetical protein
MMLLPRRLPARAETAFIAAVLLFPLVAVALFLIVIDPFVSAAGGCGGG